MLSRDDMIAKIEKFEEVARRKVSKPSSRSSSSRNYRVMLYIIQIEGWVVNKKYTLKEAADVFAGLSRKGYRVKVEPASRPKRKRGGEERLQEAAP